MRRSQRTLLIALAGSLACAGVPRAAQPPSPEQLVQLLRAGGYVLVLRHAQAPRNPAAGSAAEADNPRHERQLDDSGKAQARALGDALRALQIPIGQVYTSPTYRAMETARYARLTAPRTVAQLGESGQGMAATPDEAHTQWLQNAAAQAPPGGTNTLIITQMPNIVAAFGRDFAGLQDAEMIVLHPVSGQMPMLIGRIRNSEWPQLTPKP